MAVDRDASGPDPAWSDPYTCPFCDATLSDPGAGFVDHLARSGPCERGYERWRERVAGDIVGEWTG